MQCLLDGGADLKARDCNGKTALENAREYRNGVRELLQSTPLRELRTKGNEDQERKRHRHRLISLATSLIAETIYGKEDRLTGTLPAAEGLLVKFTSEVDQLLVRGCSVALNSAEHVDACQQANETWTMPCRSCMASYLLMTLAGTNQ